jgi:hypothetical protein
MGPNWRIGNHGHVSSNKPSRRVRLVAPRPEQVYPDTYWRRPLAGRADHEITGLSERDAELVELFDLLTVAAKALPRS